MIKVLYQDIESLLKINGGLSTPFKINRSVRQGCPLSGMLYALSIEPMLHRIQTQVEGMEVQDFNERYVVSAYADDLMVMVNTQKDVEKLKDTVTGFEMISAAKVNWEKSEALAVGEWKNGLPKLPGGLLWKRGGLKYLGVHLGDEITVKKNWEGLVEKVKGRLGKWKWILPHLSYRGRTLIANNLVASTLWHRLACMEPPIGLLGQLQAIIVDFFWDKFTLGAARNPFPTEGGRRARPCSPGQ